MVLTATEEPFAQPLTDNLSDPPREFDSGLPKLIKKDSLDQPDTKRPELVLMESWWRLADKLLEGTDGLKACADEFLPPLGDDEREEERKTRLRKVVCAPYYEDLLQTTVAKPFGRPVSFTGGPDGGEDSGKNTLPAGLEHLQANADGEGRSLSTLLKDHLFDAFHRSGSCLLATLPFQEAPANEADRRSQLPLIKLVSMKDIYGWDFHWKQPEDPNDSVLMVTTMLRLFELKQVKTGQFTSQSVPGIRILQAAKDANTPGFSVRYEKNKDGEWAIVDQQPYTLDRIMLSPTWTNQIGPAIGKPKLKVVAELNLVYVQDDTDQRNGGAYARISTLYTIGHTEGGSNSAAVGGLRAPIGNPFDPLPVKKAETRITRGHRRLIRIQPADAQIGLLESSGSGLTVGRAELKAQEERMQGFGAAHVTAPGVTATSTRRDDDRDTSNLRSWCTAVEQSATQAIRDCAELNGAPLPEDVMVQLFRDWSEATERQQSLEACFGAYDRSVVPARIVHQAMKRFGALAPQEDSAKLMEEAQAEKQDSEARAAELEIEKAIAAAAAGGGPQPGPGGNQPGNPPQPPTGKPPAGNPPAGGGAPGAGGKPQ